ncbi:MAG: glycosyltransferase family 39 protein [Symplocastrum torsivum CPER-KK1]|jgi:4-amino-4-deoxy-L-arabinose transferase-like glycosyltransferase|uniref:Glycosyltransferase family 39 protein n=1 Tax=Symplocastrum torsivum CPER-KK1 TaxID=450513 RepID=A0A951PM18_9CYAN|nr:glycosyltransferase family 39 protein [Symplocastrum torsivum CPER-KK1]
MKFSPLLLGIFLLSLTLRVLDITVPLNVDEVSWLSRGTLFFKNLLDGNLAETFLRHHPGVTNMWLNGSGMILNCWLDKLFPGLLNLNPSPNLNACLNTIIPWSIPINLYVIPRLLQAVITSACMVGIYIVAKQLLGRPAALAGISLLILDPFFLGYQRLITTDALQADFSGLALLLLLLYLRGDGDRKWLVASGVLMGLATAAKIPTLFLLPGVIIWIVLIELGLWRTSFPQRGWKRQIIDLMLWSMTLGAVIFLIWPALWVAPLQTFGKLFEGLEEEADKGGLFFLGQVTDSLGLTFYPLALAYRLSPAMQAGLLACLVLLLIPKLRRACKKIPELIALFLIPLCVLVFLSTIKRKYDRYFILAWPELALLAGVGWRTIGVWVKHWGVSLQPRLYDNWVGRWRTNRGVKTGILLALAQIVVLLPHYPYYLTYYNPLLGGSRTAQNLLMIGQGEGLDRAAHWLNQSPNAKEITAAVWYASAFVPYFQGRTVELNTWNSANRVVFYINGIQRQKPDPPLFAYLTAQQPLYTVQLHGVDYVRVYPGSVPLPEDLKNIQVPLSLSFGKQIRLLGYDLNSSELKPGDELLVTFYWKFLEPLPPDFNINVSLRNQDGNFQNRSDAPLLASYLPLDQIAPGTVVRDVHKLTTVPGVLPGHYRLEVGWFSPNKGQALEARDAAGNAQGSQAVIGEVEVVRQAT